MAGALWVGTSGYAYKEWKPAFYPADLKPDAFLSYYAARLRTVEINNTFYRFPSADQLEEWRTGTPEGFKFSFKAPQRITHMARLKDLALARDFVERCGTMQDKLGVILFQLPPNFQRDDDRLAAFVDGLSKNSRYAFEFRHPSWLESSTWDTLRKHAIAMCVSDGEGLTVPRELTAPHAYVRLRNEPYTPEQLAEWRKWIDDVLAGGADVYAYLKHDEHGQSPEWALRLLDPR